MKKWLTLMMSFWGLFGKSQSAQAPLQLADIFDHHMVLQQQRAVKIWGWTTPGSTVEVRVSWLPDEVFSVAAAADQHWELEIPTPAASLEAHQIQVSNQQKSIVLRDVLIGEVWLCSGQSNMEWTVRDAGYARDAVGAEQFPHIRHIKVERALSLEPLHQFKTNGWKVCNPTNVSDFSAVAYFFAVELSQKYGIPVGLVNATWGGSQIESWWSLAGMASSPLFQRYVPLFPTNWEAADQFLMQQIKQYALGAADAPVPTAAQEAAYRLFDYDISSWCHVSPQYAWDWQNLWAFRGDGFMAVDFQLSASDARLPARLHLGNPDLATRVWLNGKLLPASQQHNGGKIALKIPKKWLRDGRNRLLLHQQLQGRKAACEMGLRGSASDFFLEINRKKIFLNEGWRAMPSFAQPSYFMRGANNLPTILFNAMIQPLVGFSLAGVLWYQGESNAGRAFEYRHSFPLLIEDWRSHWNQELPFLFVQLPNYQASSGNSNLGSTWAELREAQTFALQLPKTGMAVCIDLGESHDIHPKNKKSVGQRLAREAFRVVYGENLNSCATALPSFIFHPAEGTVQIDFTPAARKLVRHETPAPSHFDIAGADRIFHPATTIHLDHSTIWVKCDAVAKPVAVRYAWADDPQVQFFWDDGCPLAPFRSDDWPGITDGERYFKF